MKKNSQAKRVTARDIAKELGITQATVSYALNGRPGVSKELAEQVQTVAKKMGYRPNRTATATRTGRSQTFGLILPDLSNPFFPALAKGAQHAALEKGFALFLFDAHNNPDMEGEAVERLLSHAVDGILWCPTSDDALKHYSGDVPTVIIDRPISGYDSVFADAVRGGKLQARYAQGRGHRQIGLLSGPSRSPSAALRTQGILEELSSDSNIVWNFELDYTTEIPPIVLDAVCAGEATCVICANDTLAVGLIGALRGKGVRVPEDVSIIGYDNIEWAQFTYPPLSTIDLPSRQLGAEAVNLLLQRLESRDAPYKEVKLAVELVERETVERLTD